MSERRLAPKALALTAALLAGATACSTGNGEEIEACGFTHHPIVDGRITTRRAAEHNWLTVGELLEYAQSGQSGVEDAEQGSLAWSDDTPDKPGEIFCYYGDQLRLNLTGISVMVAYYDQRDEWRAVAAEAEAIEASQQQHQSDCQELARQPDYSDFSFDC